jgi:hypothetical protein
MVSTIARPADSAPTAATLFAPTPAALCGLAAALICAFFAAPAVAKEEPLLEVGLGIGAIAFEDYRGSSTTHAYPLPIGYLLYNGDFLKADRDGVRGLLFNQSWVELNLSGNLTTPVKNDRDRSGMPDLRSTVEAGPSLDFHLLKSADGHVKFDLRMPVRAAFTVQAVPKYIGWTFNPRLALDLKDPAGFSRLECRLDGRTVVRRSQVPQLLLFGGRGICDGFPARLPGQRRLRRLPDARRCLQALSQILGGRLRPL